LPLARERGIAAIINRPFAGGELLRRLRTTAVPVWAADIGGTSWAPLSLKFVISPAATTCAIPATSRIEHLRDNMGAGVGVMPDGKMCARIAAPVH
jgi:diketogulonate reductase-like aldo/keto reductase